MGMKFDEEKVLTAVNNVTAEHCGSPKKGEGLIVEHKAPSPQSKDTGKEKTAKKTKSMLCFIGVLFVVMYILYCSVCVVLCCDYRLFVKYLLQNNFLPSLSLLPKNLGALEKKM